MDIRSIRDEPAWPKCSQLASLAMSLYHLRTFEVTQNWTSFIIWLRQFPQNFPFKLPSKFELSWAKTWYYLEWWSCAEFLRWYSCRCWICIYTQKMHHGLDILWNATFLDASCQGAVEYLNFSPFVEALDCGTPIFQQVIQFLMRKKIKLVLYLKWYCNQNMRSFPYMAKVCVWTNQMWLIFRFTISNAICTTPTQIICIIKMD